jgi:hypothetical protein
MSDFFVPPGGVTSARGQVGAFRHPTIEPFLLAPKLTRYTPCAQALPAIVLGLI